MLFAHTIADNETASERRHVVDLAAQYVKERNLPAERIFTVSAHEYARAKDERRAPAGWNEMDALRSTLEAHAETHMARLDRLARSELELAPRGGAAPGAREKRGFWGGSSARGASARPVERTSGAVRGGSHV